MTWLNLFCVCSVLMAGPAAQHIQLNCRYLCWRIIRSDLKRYYIEICIFYLLFWYYDCVLLWSMSFWYESIIKYELLMPFYTSISPVYIFEMISLYPSFNYEISHVRRVPLRFENNFNCFHVKRWHIVRDDFRTIFSNPIEMKCHFKSVYHQMKNSIDFWIQKLKSSEHIDDIVWMVTASLWIIFIKKNHSILLYCYSFM